MNGRPLTISREAESVPAILETWFLGVETGNAIADVLFGDVNPSGKLPVTFPRSTGQIPLYYNHKNTGRPYKDGDKYTSRYLDLPNTPLYPFGFGLSYTTFEYSDLTLGSSAIQESDSLRLSVVVKNSGLRSGDEVVQLYLRDDVASVTRPVRELKKFRRITLGTGESARVEFVLHPEDLMLTNLEMKRVLEPGTFSVYIGPNSVDCLESKFEVR
jgi:beta-glucosidase